MTHGQALRSVADRLIGVFCAILRDQAPHRQAEVSTALELMIAPAIANKSPLPSGGKSPRPGLVLEPLVMIERLLVLLPRPRNSENMSALLAHEVCPVESHSTVRLFADKESPLASRV